MSVRSKPNHEGEAHAEPGHDGNELPEGWVTAELQDVASMRLGKMLDAGKQVGDALPYLRNINVRWGTFDVADLLTMRFKEQEAEEFAIRNGDVLVCEGGEPGRAAVWNQGPTNIKFQKAIHRIRVTDALEPGWLMYHLRNDAINGVLADYFTGSTIKHLTGVVLKRYAIRLPPLAEQRRIVGKLELLLGKVSSSQQRLSRVPVLLKRFRQSVLAAACSGKLTADWREENEATPIDSPTEIDIPADFPTLPESWSWTTLESVCVNVVDCPHSTPKWTDAGKLCIRTTNFLPGILALSEVRYVSAETFNERIERLRPAPGDIVYSREGGILGIACQIPPGVELCLGQRMMLFRVGSEYTATLLMHWLNSPVITHRVQELTGGSASPHLNVRDIRAFPTPAPPMSEQQEIVRRVEKLFAFADQIEARLKQAQAHVDRLTQSLLAKAFRGELVPTEHALATAASRDYEPASELLERIRTPPISDASVTTPRRRNASLSRRDAR